MDPPIDITMGQPGMPIEITIEKHIHITPELYEKLISTLDERIKEPENDKKENKKNDNKNDIKVDWSKLQWAYQNL